MSLFGFSPRKTLSFALLAGTSACVATPRAPAERRAPIPSADTAGSSSESPPTLSCRLGYYSKDRPDGASAAFVDSAVFDENHPIHVTDGKFALDVDYSPGHPLTTFASLSPVGAPQLASVGVPLANQAGALLFQLDAAIPTTAITDAGGATTAFDHLFAWCQVTTPGGATPPPSIDTVDVANRDLVSRLVDQATTTRSDSLIIAEHGTVVFENHFGIPIHEQSIQSVTKSVCAMAIGNLLRTHADTFSLEDPMSKWVPTWADDAQKKQITVRMILDHTSGLPEGAEFPADLIAYAENLALENPPGTAWVYSDAGIALLDRVIAGVAGKPTDQYVGDTIFEPLGIRGWSWAHDDAGHVQTGGGLYLKPTDLLRLGELMLDQGTFEGAPVLSPDWVHAQTTKSQTFAAYGLLWWLYPSDASHPDVLDVYSAQGWGGQWVTVFPARGIVAVRTKDPETIDPMNAEATWMRDFPNAIGGWR
jgi:hypothetical protein